MNTAITACFSGAVKESQLTIWPDLIGFFISSYSPMAYFPYPLTCIIALPRE